MPKALTALVKVTDPIHFSILCAKTLKQKHLLSKNSKTLSNTGITQPVVAWLGEFGGKVNERVYPLQGWFRVYVWYGVALPDEG